MLSLSTQDLEYLIDTSREAGAEVMDVYADQFQVRRKKDDSPLTEADLRSHRLIARRLSERFPQIPILSEESAEEAPYDVRKNWAECWMVDPLDGTKEFIKRNGQFTVNIALIQHERPVAGVVYAPARNVLYCSGRGTVFRQEDHGERRPLHPCESAARSTLRVVGSLSHRSPEMEEFLTEQRRAYQKVEFVAMGSSLKICLVAEGSADVYPRFGPTMEWDTAAAHAIARGAGRKVLRHGTGDELRYNKPDRHNPWFVIR